MDNIQIALDNINKSIDQLNKVKLILEQEQPIVTEHGDDVNVEHSDAYYDYTRNDPNAKNPFTEPKDIERAEKVTGKVNTYRIEALYTNGWALIDKKLTHLKREDASRNIQNLIDGESYNPDDLRVVVDGQV
tara:strand:+ start:712 stop:1107 length:396 start_codon:yes stop_codon:yes gene_type:complete